MKIYAFIFARGGSKGLPGKNIKLLGGVPLIGHSIRLAQKINLVEKVFVSTDCDQIAKVAEEFSAEVIRRPDELASDTASEWFAWQHAINELCSRGERFDVFLSLPATSPLRAKEDVERCIAELDECTDMVVTVTPAARSPYFNMLVRDENGRSEVMLRNDSIRRRQDAPVAYDMTTVAYVSRPDFILNSAGLFSGCVKSVVVPKERAVDIDDGFDFMVAEALYQEGK
ncbi:acylneuraminate cytidylyltransferase family protein [Pseudomonas putida]|uniref:acylneuraminate cytidylyltransferase family protein n=1 Tax=Pseudomonas putida TaxID=303 RepID=UPI0018ABD4A4|nr:acylneuraminate cytidylyltransferase family protein [Pseudomonas putida]MBF8669045.1 acylneuraminate cytidylyltransferase family protein [Pseudomonas putida]MBF8711014.1 acylneuraminate cytidylyltransferase family protein [Pseudomonas putida]